MKVYSAIAQALWDGDQTVIFGIMGDTNMHYLSEFSDLGGEFVYSITEGAAVAMADGYARVSGKTGIASVTNGPGITNAITALIEANRASSPVILVTGRTVRERGKLQDLDVRAAADLSGVEYRTALTADHVVDEIGRAQSYAQSTRRPVLLDIENDFLIQDVDYQKTRFGNHTRQPVRPSAEAIDEALGVIASCKRPIVLAGSGAVISGAIPKLVELADLIQAPLATTLSARDAFAGADYNLGIMGTLAHDVALDTIQGADCIIAFGASLNRYTAAEGGLLAGKAVVQCDSNPANIARYFPATAAVVGDARATAEAFLEILKLTEVQEWTARTPQLRERLAAYSPSATYSDRSSERGLDMRTAAIRLNEILPRDRAVVTDCGRFDFAAWRFLRVCQPQDFMHTVHFGSMGLSIPTAVGAAIANRERVTVVACGDAGGLVGLPEIVTAARYRLPLVIVVFNDGSWGSEYTKLAASGIEPEHSLLNWPSIAGVARGLGATATEIRTVAELENVSELVAGMDGPVLVDIRCDPDVNPNEYP